MFGNSVTSASGGILEDTNKDEVILLVYTPKMVPTQVIRPYQYSFTGDVIEGFAEVDYNREKGTPMSFKDCDKLHEALIPDANGIKVHNDLLSTRWTFTLILTLTESSYKKIVFGKRNKTIAVGYFTEEPFAPDTLYGTTPIINHNSVMVFTHSTTISLGIATNVGVGGVQENGGYINRDGDTFSNALSQYMTTDMYTMTPGDLRQSVSHTKLNDFDGLGLGGELTIDNSGKVSLNVTPQESALNTFTAPTMIKSTQKSPKHHLMDIGRALTKGISIVGDNDNIYSEIDLGIDSDVEDIMNRELPYRNSITVESAIDPTNKGRTNITMMQFEKAFPNATIQPIQLNYTSEWEITPQDYVTQETVLGSIIAPTVQSLATGVGLSEIAFHYCSYNPSMLTSDGNWEILTDPFCIHATQDPQHVKKTAMRFMQHMEQDLFPILKHLGGEFEMIVRYDMVGETLVDFRYLDNPHIKGFLEIPNRFSSIVSPNIGNLDMFTNNVNNLQNLYDYAKECEYNLTNELPPKNNIPYIMSHGVNEINDMVIPM